MDTLSFQYDAFDRRTRNHMGTRFLHDGVNPIMELNGNAPVASMLSGGVDEVFQRADATGAWAYLADALGSALALADAAGALQTQYTYEPFGNTSSTGVTGINPFQFTGRENDGTGLYYYRARYYYPALHRFVGEDPAGDGDNFYTYAGDDPANLLDPFGLAVAAPGFWESLIPIWGSGRQALHDFDCGNYLSGAVNLGLAASDAFLVGSLAKTLGKVGLEGLFKTAGSHTWDATRKWMATEGWRDFPSQAFHHWAIPRNGWGSAVPGIVKNQPWNIMKMTAEEHIALHGMEGAARVWYGTPVWAKVAGADAMGKMANLAARKDTCE